jgi:hypothetical protein
MTNQKHPIAPPPKLVRYWARFQSYTPEALSFCIANEAAQWGYQQAVEELEAFLRKDHDKS